MGMYGVGEWGPGVLGTPGHGGLGEWGRGTWGLGDTGAWENGDTGVWGHGGMGTWHGDIGVYGDMGGHGPWGHGCIGTRGGSMGPKGGGPLGVCGAGGSHRGGGLSPWRGVPRRGGCSAPGPRSAAPSPSSGTRQRGEPHNAPPAPPALQPPSAPGIPTPALRGTQVSGNPHLSAPPLLSHPNPRPQEGTRVSGTSPPPPLKPPPSRGDPDAWVLHSQCGSPPLPPP